MQEVVRRDGLCDCGYHKTVLNLKLALAATLSDPVKLKTTFLPIKMQNINRFWMP